MRADFQIQISRLRPQADLKTFILEFGRGQQIGTPQTPRYVAKLSKVVPAEEEHFYISVSDLRNVTRRDLVSDNLQYTRAEVGSAVKGIVPDYDFMKLGCQRLTT